MKLRFYCRHFQASWLDGVQGGRTVCWLRRCSVGPQDGAQEPPLSAAGPLVAEETAEGTHLKRGRVLKDTGQHTANYDGNPETHWLVSDAPLSSLSRMLSRHLLELVSLTICPQPLKPPRTSQGRGPAWLVASELLAEQCGTESRLQSSGRDSKKHSQLQENSGHGRAEGQPVSSGPRWTCLRFTWG